MGLNGKEVILEKETGISQGKSNDKSGKQFNRIDRKNTPVKTVKISYGGAEEC
jgi:hypothetical protein